MAKKQPIRSTRHTGIVDNSVPAYHGQDLNDLWDKFGNQNGSSHIDKDWLDKLGSKFGFDDPSSNLGGSSTGGSGLSSSGSTSRGLFDPIKHTLNEDSDWKNILSTLGSNSDFGNFLASLGIGGKDPFDANVHDWNSELLKQILQYYLTSEQRGYDRALQLDQRLYDSPSNQLARLMGAGISRDAAIQMLSGGSGGSGAGVPYGQTGNQADLTPASQSYANQVSAATNIAGAVFNGVGAFAGLVNLGFSIPQALQQTQFLKSQNYLIGSQVNAFQSAGKAFAILNNAGAAADAFGSVSSAGSALVELAKSGNPDAIQFLSSGGLQAMKENAPFASQTLGSLYQSERSSADYNKRFAAEMRKMNADAYLQELSYDALLVDIDKSSAELDQIVTQTDFIEENIRLAHKQANVLEKQADLLVKQGRQVDADILLSKATKLRTDAETESINLQNRLNKNVLDSKIDGETGLHWATENTLRNLYNSSRILAKTGNEKMFNAQASMMLADFQSLTAVHALMAHRAGMSLEYAKEHPSEAQFGSALEDLGLSTYFGITNAGRVKIYNTDVTTPEYVHLLDALGK